MSVAGCGVMPYLIGVEELSAYEPFCSGRVTGVSGAVYLVTTGDGRLLRCRTVAGTQSAAADASLLCVGDLVDVQLTPGGVADPEGLIAKVHARSSVLVRRRDPRRNRSKEKQQVIASNIELLVPVVSVDDPPLSTRLVDRYLVFAESERLPVLIVVNKMDLDEEGGVRELMAVYHDLGYRVCYISVLERRGIDELNTLLAGSVSAFSGHSGVGKSSIINLLTGGTLKTSQTSFKTGRGVHTTSNAVMLPLPDGGAVIDTPGIREFSLVDITRENLRFYFPEFLGLMPHCMFSSCTHTVEPGCAVRSAVGTGLVHDARYASYLVLFETVEETGSRQKSVP